MAENPFMEQRKERKLKLLEVINVNPSLSVAEIIGVFTLKYGVTEKTARAYYKELEAAHLIERIKPTSQNTQQAHLKV